MELNVKPQPSFGGLANRRDARSVSARSFERKVRGLLVQRLELMAEPPGATGGRSWPTFPSASFCSGCFQGFRWRVLGPGGVAAAGRGAERLQGMVERGADGAQMVRRTWWSDRENPVTEGLP